MGYYVLNLSRFLFRQGHSVKIFTRGGIARTTEDEIEGIPVRSPRFIPLYPFHVHFHGHYLRRALSESNSEFDLFHLHSPLVPSLRTDTPKVLTVHTPMKSDVRSIPVRDLFSLLLRFQLPISVSLEKRALRSVDAIAAVSSTVSSELKHYGIDPKSVHVVGNGVDTLRFTPRSSTKKVKPYIFACGRLGPRKGFEDLIESAKRVVEKYPEMEFWIAGEGEKKRALEKRIRELDLAGNMRLIGHVKDRDEMAKNYRDAIAFVHPAHYEGLPTALLEAMSCGSPVVSTAVSGALDVIEDRKNGLLVPARDPTLMASAIIALLKDPSMRELLGRQARRTILERYSWSTIGNKYLNIYRKVIG